MKTILAATDFSTRSDRALRRAVLTARQISAELVLVHVLDDDLPEHLFATQRDAAEALLADMTETIEAADGLACTYRLEVGSAFRILGDAAREMEPELVVMGPHRRNILKDIFVGTTVERTIRESPVPVIMANGVPASPYSHVVIATDFSDCSVTAAKNARELGLLEEATITVIHIADRLEAGMIQRSLMTDDELEGYLGAQHEENAGRMLSFLNATGIKPYGKRLERAEISVPETILGAVRKIHADLLVVGTHGKSGLEKYFLGSVAEELLKRAEIDVLAVPA